LKLLSLPTFFAAAKKVGAAPHRGNANKPTTNQGKAKNPRTTTKNKTNKNNKKTTPPAGPKHQR
jgi:general secretion pathway protein K